MKSYVFLNGLFYDEKKEEMFRLLYLHDDHLFMGLGEEPSPEEIRVMEINVTEQIQFMNQFKTDVVQNQKILDALEQLVEIKLSIREEGEEYEYE